jgi:polyferredoxin
MNGKGSFNLKKLIVPGAVMIAFWVLAVIGWQASGNLQPLFLFGYIGAALGVGLGLYALLPKKKKPMGRRLALFLIGAGVLIFMGVLQSENMQIEWVFFSLMGGLMGAALAHYLIAKIFGPLLFGRLWCGWACWTLMILDLLPYKRPGGRVPGHWGMLRYAHFAFSFGLVAVLWYGFDYRDPIHYNSRARLYWLVIGNAVYYLLGIGMAIILKDNRAFCKYVCPVAVPLKITSRFSLLKIGGYKELCTDCGACEKMCSMDIRIAEYILDGQRVLSTECSLCQTCVTVCARDALKLSFGFDLGGKELLTERSQPALAGTRPQRLSLKEAAGD